jgi:hypothetical protein
MPRPRVQIWTLMKVTAVIALLIPFERGLFDAACFAAGRGGDRYSISEVWVGWVLINAMMILTVVGTGVGVPWLVRWHIEGVKAQALMPPVGIEDVGSTGDTMRRTRVRIWMMMVVIVLVGVTLAIWKARERYARLQTKYEAARSHAALQEEFAQYMGVTEPRGSPDAEYTLRRRAYWGKLRRKYEQATMHPWESVEPDPPEPE